MSHISRYVTAGAAAAMLMVLTTACGDDQRTGSSPVSVSAVATNGSSATTPESEPPPTDAIAKTGEPSRDSAVTVTDLRIGHHDGYDRVVYEFGGKGTPGFHVKYVEKAVQDASGKDLPVQGRSILEVLIPGSAYPFDSGVEEYSGPDPLTEPTATAVAEVQLATLFEGVTQSFIGVESDKPPFRVEVLSNPTRLVVDVAN
ncbi:hypothetical protein [Antrihabitans sp. YC2-6]|uniref:AMIN-like domain-containing (lipo)protein n=1 Tax=Antrihabitans sp. YC2-6 TaxID=2799498 RepID=UPI0018F3D994|nr:hypothetical protein [Antrihabitans sp. YC2-6]MBJ8348735.1 hypothetical protein [Antrihabitans sp. YC2-6]